jgi:site-specific DNA-methyltransferase (adenine-specific)
MKSEAYNVDCMEAMKGMPDKAFDLAIVDPPYGIGNWVQVTGDVRRDSRPVTWNDSIPNAEYFHELKRVSVDQIIWGANYYNCFSNTGGAIIWDKQNPNPKFSNAEIAAYSKHKRVAMVTIPYFGFVGEEKCFHPCAKPIELYKWLLTNYAKPGDSILDTHLGSGSSRIAAYDLGFDFVGYELDKDYFDAQEQRFANHIAQPKLFAPVQAAAEQGEIF